MDRDHPFSRWLKASGFTVQEIAHECGVSRTAVYNWCYGANPPNVHHLAQLYRISRGAVQPWFWARLDKSEVDNGSKS